MMYIEVGIAGESFQVLLDSGASHSFISNKLVKAIPLPVRELAAKSVRLPNGSVLRSAKYAVEDIQLGDAVLFK